MILLKLAEGLHFVPYVYWDALLWMNLHVCMYVCMYYKCIIKLAGIHVNQGDDVLISSENNESKNYSSNNLFTQNLQHTAECTISTYL